MGTGKRVWTKIMFGMWIEIWFGSWVRKFWIRIGMVMGEGLGLYLGLEVGDRDWD